jgi:hypothetical protein
MAEEHIPDELADPFDMLSFLFLDGGGTSKLGVHTDTQQLMPVVCSCDSLYPPGCYDFTRGEFFGANGVWGDPYGRRDAVVVLGHTTTHTVLPLTPSPSGQVPFPELRGCHMLRGSLVHWSHGGKELCHEWFRMVHEESESHGPPSGEFWRDVWREIRRSSMHVLAETGTEQAMRVTTRRHRDAHGGVEHERPLWDPNDPCVVSVLGEHGQRLRLVLRLRGAGCTAEEE